MKKTLMIILSMGMMAFAASAQAATASGTVAVSAIAVNSCSATSTSPTAFGNFSGAQIDLLGSNGTSGNVGYICTAATPVNIALDAGGNYSAGTRHMSDGAGHLLAYELYQHNALTLLFGDAGVTHPGTVRSFTGASMSSALPARMAAAASYVPGSYSDTVNITVTY